MKKQLPELLILLANKKHRLKYSLPEYSENEQLYRTDHGLYVSRPKAKNIKALQSDEFKAAVKKTPFHLIKEILATNRVHIMNDGSVALDEVISRSHELQRSITRIIEDIYLVAKMI